MSGVIKGVMMILVVIKMVMMRVVVINQHDDGDGCGGQYVQPGDQHVVLADQVLDLFRPRISELFPLGLQLDKLSVLCTESKERALDLMRMIKAMHMWNIHLLRTLQGIPMAF